MNWNEKEKHLTNWTEVKEYLLEDKSFCNHRIGAFTYDSKNNTISLCIEQTIFEEPLSEKIVKIWNFLFIDIENLEFSMNDILFGFYISGFNVEDNRIIFNADGCYLEIKSAGIELSIPI